MDISEDRMKAASRRFNVEGWRSVMYIESKSESPRIQGDSTRPLYRESESSHIQGDVTRPLYRKKVDGPRIQERPSRHIYRKSESTPIQGDATRPPIQRDNKTSLND